MESVTGEDQPSKKSRREANEPTTIKIATSYDELKGRLKYKDEVKFTRKEELSQAKEERLLEEYGVTRDDVARKREEFLAELRDADWAERNPQQRSQLEKFIQVVFFEDQTNGCLMHCPDQQSRTHTSFLNGCNCLAGCNEEDCHTYRMAKGLEPFFARRSSLIVGRGIKSTIFFEREICPTPNREFTRCPPYNDVEVKDEAAVVDFYLRVNDYFKTDLVFWSCGGTMTNAQSIMDRIDFSKYPRCTALPTSLSHMQYLGTPLPHTINGEDNRRYMFEAFTPLSDAIDAKAVQMTGQQPKESLIDFMCKSNVITAFTRNVEEATKWFNEMKQYKSTNLNEFLPSYCRKADGNSLVFSPDANHDSPVRIYTTKHFLRMQVYFASKSVTIATPGEVTIQHLCQYHGHRSLVKQIEQLSDERFDALQAYLASKGLTITTREDVTTAQFASFLGHSHRPRKVSVEPKKNTCDVENCNKPIKLLGKCSGCQPKCIADGCPNKRSLASGYCGRARCTNGGGKKLKKP